jgi:predicted NAD/FAD-dependent oxidoreductase
MTRIAIIGAGMAGVTLAYTLKDKAEIILVEKSRGLSGRISHRRVDRFGFDHGAAYMTVRDRQFADILAPYLSAGLLQNWPKYPVTLKPDQTSEQKAPSSDSYAVSGAANNLVKSMAKDYLADIDIRLATKVSHISSIHSGSGSRWHIAVEQGSDDRENPDIVADWVISTAPASQTAGIMPPSASFHRQLADVKMQGCFTLMLGFDKMLDTGWDAAWGAHDQPIGFIADNSKKPGRDHTCSALTIHAGNVWSSDHLASDQDMVKEQMIAALYALTGIDANTAAHISLHRWLYANPVEPLRKSFVMDASSRLAGAGDWCLGGRIENAFLSALALGRAIRPLL